MADGSARLGKGSRIGPYEILGVLGRGGMATVYKAYQSSLDRNVAIKVIAERYASDPTFAERFRREARSIARLHHPNILTVHDAGEDNGLLYIVMELVEGDTLRDEMNRNPLSLERSAKVLGQVGAALNYANKQGIIHRDIKPSNVLFDAHNDRAVLSDFGIAKMLDNTAAGLTGTNEGLGTPDYMSPEQANGTQLDGRSDEYSLAAMAFELVTRQTPFHADTPIAIVMGHLSKPVPSTRQINHDIPPALDAVITKGLSKNPNDRYPSVADFTEAFQKAVNNPQVSPQPVVPPAIAAQPLNYNANQNSGPYSLGQQAPSFVPPAQPNWVNPVGSQPAPYQQRPPTPPPQQYQHPPTPAPQQYNAQTGPGFNQGYNAYPNSYTPPKKSNVGLLLGGIAAIAIIAIIILAAILALGGDKNDGATPTTQVSQVTATQGSNVIPTATGKAVVTSDIPVPPNSTKIDISAQDIAKLNPDVDQANISKVNYGFYASSDSSASLLTFYQNEMKNRGWTQDMTQSDTTGGLFKKGDQSAGLALLPITSDAQLTGLNGAFPAMNGKIKVGQTMVIVASGPSSVFKTTPGTPTAPAPTNPPQTTAAPASGSATPGGFPIEGSLNKITADPDAQKSLEAPYQSLGNDVHVLLYTSPKSIDELKAYYKGEPDGWAFVSENTKSNFVYEYFIKNGQGALVGLAPITKVFINASDTPASLRSQLKEGDTFVFLVDNLDYSKAGITPTTSAVQPPNAARAGNDFLALSVESANLYRKEL